MNREEILYNIHYQLSHLEHCGLSLTIGMTYDLLLDLAINAINPGLTLEGSRASLFGYPIQIIDSLGKWWIIGVKGEVVENDGE